MNLQPLYDLKERLEYAAIAGTGLMQEDFRLRRAVEALVPLAAVSAVFGKISIAARALLTAPQEERSTRLLDVLSLVDAVVYTQGVTNLNGDLEPLPCGNGTYVQASYGTLQPLLIALSGRTSLIQKYWTEHPDYFGDFRVLPHVVRALGDNYGELAELISDILMKQGVSIIPLLKEGFDPAGKAEMTRRVRLIAKLAGGTENDWFVSILSESKKDVRESVIQALSMSQENAQLLLDLCQSERGKLKEAALRALAMMEDEKCIDFWKKEAAKRPASVTCLKGVGSSIAADLIAAELRTFLENMLSGEPCYDQKNLEGLNKLTAVAAGKYSAQISILWHWIADHMDRFARIVPEKSVRNCDLTVAELLQKTMIQTVLWNCAPEVLDLARSLSAKCREWFFCCALLADMAVLPAAELYERYAPCIAKTGLLRKETPAERSDRIQIMRGLSAVRWSGQLHAYYVAFTRFDALTGNATNSIRKLDGVDPGWMKLLTDPKVNQDGAVYNLSISDHYRRVDPAIDWVISCLIDEDNPEICDMAGSWLCRWIMDTGNLNDNFHNLLRCGWKNWKGVLAHCAAKSGGMTYYMIISLLRQMPITNMEKAAELRQLDAMVQNQLMTVRISHWSHDAVLRTIAVLEADPNAEI